MSDPTFFAGAHNFVVSGGTFSTQIINYNIVRDEVNEGARTNLIPAPQQPNSTLAMVAPYDSGSIGNIVIAISIVQSIYTTLSDSAGSSFEYTCLINELRSFEDALRRIDSVLQTTPMSRSLRQDIDAETAHCLKLLRKFSGRIKASEVERFRRKLSDCERSIRLFLGGRDLALIYAIQRQPPRSVGHDLKNALILIDALGSRITLPMQLCFSEQDLHMTLIQLFNGKIGQDHIQRHNYSISTEDGKSIAMPDNWGAVVKKGRVIVMSVIVKKVGLKQKHANRQRNACPHCYETRNGVMPNDGWLQCRRCDRHFGWSDTTIHMYLPPSEDLTIADFRNIRVVPVTQHVR
ncbi:hypothetical protein BDN70DRAFT_888376 [Pholiota conissans]|uniref:Ubiquitin-like domain-containing protein n=1 Tax=Pholiota conissans TaxID=109636 RepID=A0A9P5YL08_9AGAR|nr:hypothetical protein BDN70DRAFT_888376 [Pholiota conissans]